MSAVARYYHNKGIFKSGTHIEKYIDEHIHKYNTVKRIHMCTPKNARHKHINAHMYIHTHISIRIHERNNLISEHF